MIHIEIRSASEEDLPAVLSLYVQSGLEHGASPPLEEARRIFARFANYPNYSLYVATLGGKVVGTFVLLIMDALLHRGVPQGIVEDMAVHPHWQRRGIGKQMMQYAMEHCQKRGCYKVMLSSNITFEAAHRFYQKLGFKKHGFSFVVDLTADDR